MKTTTFIVGAGASTDFGLPVGGQLVDRIRDRLVHEIINPGPRPILDAAMNCGLDGDFEQAAKEIAGGMIAARSIDRFLHSRTGDELVKVVGKCAIAAVLSSAEGNSSLAVTDENNWLDVQMKLTSSKSSWLYELFAILNEGLRKEDYSKMFKETKFVVFNYDRCIERYIYLALVHIGGCSPNEAEDIVKEIPIVHIYGSLGPIGQSDDAILYGKGESRLSEIWNKIRTFTESADEKILFDARNLIHSSEAIVFLGFAFDDLNLKAIFDKPINVPWAGTCVGLHPQIQHKFVNEYCEGDSKSAGFFRNQNVSSLINSDTFRSLIS